MERHEVIFEGQSYEVLIEGYGSLSEAGKAKVLQSAKKSPYWFTSVSHLVFICQIELEAANKLLDREDETWIIVGFVDSRHVVVGRIATAEEENGRLIEFKDIPGAGIYEYPLHYRRPVGPWYPIYIGVTNMLKQE